MKKINFLPWFMLLLATLAACAEDKDVPQKQGTPLQLSVTTTKLQSKALIEASTLPDEGTLGLSLVDAGGRTYDKAAYDNVKATAAGTGISQTWSFETDLILTGAEGTLYAYHPFDPEVTDVRSIAVTAGETDYMWASPVSGLLFSNAKAQVTMNHALSAIRLKVVRGSYKGDGHVTSLTVKADNIASSATLDATTGSLSEMAGAGTPLERSADFTLSESSEKVDFVVVPVLKKGAAATFTLVVDGKAYTVGASQLTYEQGSLYTYTLTVNSADLSLSNVTVGDWGYNTDGEPVIRVNGKTVTLTGNTEGIAFNNAVNPDGTVTIQAYTIVPQKHVEEVYVSGASTLQQTLDEETGIRTITLSSITADEEVNFQGVWYPVYIEGDMDGMTFARRRAADGSLTVTATPDDAEDIVKEASGSGEATFTQTVHATTNVRTLTVSAQNSPYTINMNGISSTWLVATYDITATGSTQILGNVIYCDLSKISAMKVDGVSVTPTKSYNFGTTGEHIVKYKLKDNTVIPQYLMYGTESLKEIRIPEGVKTIEEQAFIDCSGLTGKLVLPNSVTSIGDEAFENCSGLTGELVIPKSVTSIGESAFDRCSGLTGELVIPKTVKSIGENAFVYCRGFTSLDLGTGVQTIGRWAFQYCSGLTGKLVIPNSVTSIGESAFDGCSGLTGELVIPNSVTSIGDYAFMNCSSLNALSLGANLKTIGVGAYTRCTGLTGKLVIPNSVIKINSRAFQYCENLTSLELGTGVQTIGNEAFKECKGFKGALRIPNSVTSIENRAFYGCSGFTGTLTIPNSITKISEYTFGGCSGLSGTLTIPESVTTIGTCAFVGCSTFTGLTIPESVTTIGASAFSGCKGLNGILRIPDSVTSIEEEVFYNCSGFTELYLGKGVQTIGEKAFEWCSGFTLIDFGSRLQTIGVSSFGDCSGLKSIEIPNSVTEISNYAFDGCHSVISVELGTGLQKMGNDVFGGFTSLKSIVSYANKAPTVSYNTFSGVQYNGILTVTAEATGYDTWMQTSSGYLGYKQWTLQKYTLTDCISLSITADDVRGDKSYTEIHYTAICKGTVNLTGETLDNIKISGTINSNDFGQNPSTTDSREITVSYTYMGVTASTSITQSRFIETSYTVNLNNQWQNSSKANPNSSLYDGVYESFSNYNVSNSGATMTIKVVGYTTFTIYIRSYAESSCDYVMASALDQNITYSTSYSNTTLVKAHTRGSQSSGTAISNYKEVIYDIPDDGEEHTITIVYRKDGSANSRDDKGYLLIAKP